MHLATSNGGVGSTLLKLWLHDRGRKIDEIVHDQDGYWLYTQKGWANPEDFEFHTYHELTVAALLQSYRQSKPVPCSCSRCSS